MRLVPYIVALGLYGTMLLAGAGIAGFGLLTMLEMAVRATRYFSSGGPITESSSISFLVQFFAFWALVVALGGGVFWFAARGALQRIRTGLPGAQEGVGRSVPARIGLGVLFAAAFLWGAVGFALGIAVNVEFAMLGFTGTTTEGKPKLYRSTDDPRRWVVEYEFHTPDGTIFKGTTLASSTNPDPPRILSLPVTYDPANPSHNDVFASWWLIDILFFVVSRGLVALVGLWGIVRNIAPPRVMPAEEDDPPEPTVMRVAPTVRQRTSFGRRGV